MRGIMTKSLVFIDSEISLDNKILDLGAISDNRDTFHSASFFDFTRFIKDFEYLCGHNLVHHDMKYIEPRLNSHITNKYIDTLYLSPLIFPKRPYHALMKDEKLKSDELNNPLNDAIRAQQLFYDELNAYYALSDSLKQIYGHLLSQFIEFKYFFEYVELELTFIDLETLIKTEFMDLICANVNLELMIQNNPIELAYALALIGSDDYQSITPRWLLKNYPDIEAIIKHLRNIPCELGCSYCQEKLNIHEELRRIFGYPSFRTFDGEPLQEKAAQAAVDGKSLLAVFPTGGGKSLTFQLPALMAGQAVHGLTVVISPLQSLMKDQVDNLNEAGIVDAVTINGLLSPVERADAYDRVHNGMATILYISPEMLRSRTMENALLSRHIVRFVIDEAHCFSAWGHDFRVDYLYIGDFIRQLQDKKSDKKTIPVSCFTATAKQKVITDIFDYFQQKLDLDLELYATAATRTNLRYKVSHQETEEKKYNALRNLLTIKDCPTIVYVSRTKRTLDLADKLTSDGFPARPFNGKLDPNVKIANQEAFINNEVKIIVATSAFGMGVDKSDVGLVVHYDISDSLENYVQEAGRAGRNPTLEAECHVLYNDQDLDKHFLLLNQSKLSMSEIQQVWQSIKYLTKFRSKVSCSALEIARQAGWNDGVYQVETRVKTAVAALENAGYLERGRNVPHVYATSIIPKNMEEASIRLEASPLFSPGQKRNAKRIISSLISSRSIAKAGNDEAESRVDYLADMLGIDKSEVINAVNLMRQEGLLADAQDMSAYILKSDSLNKSLNVLKRFEKLEAFILEKLKEDDYTVNYKEWNEEALDVGITYSNIKSIKKILNFLVIKNYIHKRDDAYRHKTAIQTTISLERIFENYYRRIDICHFIVNELYSQVKNQESGIREETPVSFSLVGLLNAYKAIPKLDLNTASVVLSDIADALLYLSKIGSMKLEGGFLVIYQGMEIKRLVTDNRVRYKVDDYHLLNEYYKQKIRQVHIVGEYASLMVKDYDAALQYVQDYFQLDYNAFIHKYFKGERLKEINRNITPKKYEQLFGELSEIQSQIINDDESKYIVVAAGPGSGKTRVLVHKLASLLLLEDVKHDQLLMLTFSRAAATEFKQRLFDLIGNAAHFVDIKTFHSYCFDLLGKIGKLDGIDDVVKNAAEMIYNGEVEANKIMKSVLVIDEAQDMDENEFALIQALMHTNEDMRIIAVGDDDQNIFAFRGSDSKYFQSFVEEYDAIKYEMDANYRSKKRVVALGNHFVTSLSNRMKQNPIVSMSDEEGSVEIVYHKSKNIEEAMINRITNTYKNESACVLTNTNYDAFQIQGLLNKEGVRTKLVQANEGFWLYNLAEVRFFIKFIDDRLNQVPVIDDALWKLAKNQLKQTYAHSTCLDNCLNMIKTFEKNNFIKYRSDFIEFIKESNYDDFYTDEKGILYISTIHKSKGREYDTVYLFLNHVTIQNDENRRKLYVGMTRAKETLYVHTNTDIFKGYNRNGIILTSDSKLYKEPSDIYMQLTHSDIFLNFSKDKKSSILRLRCGQSLKIKKFSLTASINGKEVEVLRFSKSFIERLETLKDKGYELTEATIGYVVAWQGEEDLEESAIILPNLHLKKKKT